MEERVKVVNLVSSRVNIDLPEVRLKRMFLSHVFQFSQGG